MQEFVYFVSYQNGPIKIGKAKNISARMSGLQTGSPHKLELMGVMKGREGLERSLHYKFSDLRMSGEWFERKDRLLTFIEKNSSDPASLFYKPKYLQMDQELSQMKLTVKNRTLEIEQRFQKEVEQVLVQNLTEDLSGALQGIVKNYRGLMRLHSSIIEGKATYGDVDAAEKDIRVELQHLLKIDWRGSRVILNSRKFEKADVNIWVKEYLERNLQKAVKTYFDKRVV